MHFVYSKNALNEKSDATVTNTENIFVLITSLRNITLQLYQRVLKTTKVHLKTTKCINNIEWTARKADKGKGAPIYPVRLIGSPWVTEPGNTSLKDYIMFSYSRLSKQPFTQNNYFHTHLITQRIILISNYYFGHYYSLFHIIRMSTFNIRGPHWTTLYLFNLDNSVTDTFISPKLFHINPEPSRKLP